MAGLGLHPRLARALLDATPLVGERAAAEVVALLDDDTLAEGIEVDRRAGPAAIRVGGGCRALAGGGRAAAPAAGSAFRGTRVRGGTRAGSSRTTAPTPAAPRRPSSPWRIPNGWPGPAPTPPRCT